MINLEKNLSRSVLHSPLLSPPQEGRINEHRDVTSFVLSHVNQALEKKNYVGGVVLSLSVLMTSQHVYRGVPERREWSHIFSVRAQYQQIQLISVRMDEIIVLNFGKKILDWPARTMLKFRVCFKFVQNLSNGFFSKSSDIFQILSHNSLTTVLPMIISPRCFYGVVVFWDRIVKPRGGVMENEEKTQTLQDRDRELHRETHRDTQIRALSSLLSLFSFIFTT